MHEAHIPKHERLTHNRLGDIFTNYAENKLIRSDYLNHVHEKNSEESEILPT